VYSDATPIITNYVINLTLISIIFYFKLFPRDNP